MTKAELLEMAKKLQAQAESMPDEVGDNPTTTDGGNTDTGSENTETTGGENTNTGDENAEPETNANDEVEENKSTEPQTNGVVTDDVQAGHNTEFEQSTNATETAGVEEVLSANLDQRFATILTDIGNVKAEMDKMKVALSEILTRIELVQEVTDKVSTIDHDSLLSESIKLLV